jgi:3-oxoadipate enol-lactonase
VLVSIRGVRLNVIDTGGAGRPVVLLHGIGGSVADWAPQLEDLQDRHRVVALDARGFGRSDRTYGAMSFADYAADVIDVLDMIDVERPIVVGLSLGGMIAQAVALADPGRIDGVVLCDTSAALDPPLVEALRLAQQLVISDGMGQVGELFLPSLAGPGVTEASHPWFAGFCESFRSTDPLVFSTGLGAIAGLDHLPRLGELRLPVLVVHGTEDLLLPMAHAEAIASVVPGSTLHPLEGVGHLSNLEAPDAFGAALETFLAATC